MWPIKVTQNKSQDFFLTKNIQKVTEIGHIFTGLDLRAIRQPTNPLLFQPCS